MKPLIAFILQLLVWALALTVGHLTFELGWDIGWVLVLSVLTFNVFDDFLAYIYKEYIK